ncbi:cell division protein FtsB [Thermomonas sp.]|jgi:cell division protein FtsB|uniref:Cell division protein FtsB n=1 Tax=Thermomonas beijingensis TaxID=2872701 RepID=A0ABS7TE45_9GAMM|nr:cell division protein FtsB [Pseudomonadota bacterium]MBZ4186138.1 cell division protein FtsB [Thermomonas beijingensis]MDE2382059.1 cell division protein FtsB [Xanthomonadaceae bacterium]
MRLLGVLLALALLLAALQYKLWYGHGGQADVVALNAQVLAQQSENGKLQARNDALAAEVADLKSGGEAVEERARSELGLVKPGETFYRVIDHAAVQSAPPRAAEPALAPAPVATPEKLPVAQPGTPQTTAAPAPADAAVDEPVADPDDVTP